MSCCAILCLPGLFHAVLCSAVPLHAVMSHAMPCSFPVLCCAVPCWALLMPCRAMLSHAVMNHTVPYCAFQGCSMPCCAMSSCALCYHATQCRAMSPPPQTQTAHCRLCSLRWCLCHLHRAALLMGCPFLSHGDRLGCPW